MDLSAPRALHFSRVTLASLVAHLLFLLLGAGSLIGPMRVIFNLLKLPAYLPPHAPQPLLWCSLCLAWAWLGYLVLVAHLAPRPLRRRLQFAFFLVCSAPLLLRLATQPPLPRPASQAELALEQTETVLRTQALASGKGSFAATPTPATLGLDMLTDPQGASLHSGYWGHGRRLDFRLVALPQGKGPVLSARAQDPPGTIYYRAQEGGGRKAWLTVLLLGAHPVGPVRFLRDGSGQAVVSTLELSN